MIWEVVERHLPGNPMQNDTDGRVKPTSMLDMMHTLTHTNAAWVKTSTYATLFDHPTLEPSPGSELAPFSDFALFVQGSLDLSGAQLLLLDPVFRFPWRSQPPCRRSKSGEPFVIEITDANGTVVRQAFDARTGDDKPGQFSSFSVLVPSNELHAAVERVRIRNAAGADLGGFSRSRAVPRVQVVAPAAGSRLDGRVRVAWEIDDPDTPQGELRSYVAYSPDGGRSFVPIGARLAKRELVLDVDRQLPPACSAISERHAVAGERGAGLIRVFVSDGINNTYADVGELVR